VSQVQILSPRPLIFGPFIVRLAPLADMLRFSQINRVTRVHRAHVLAALTKPLARRLSQCWIRG
jgi:hypothetical protein